MDVASCNLTGLLARRAPLVFNVVLAFSAQQLRERCNRGSHGTTNQCCIGRDEDALWDGDYRGQDEAAGDRPGEDGQAPPQRKDRWQALARTIEPSDERETYLLARRINRVRRGRLRRPESPALVLYR